jgi:hypothetical protein
MGVERFSLITFDGVMSHDRLQQWYGLPAIAEVGDVMPSVGWNVISPTYARSVRFLLPGRYALTPTPWYSKIQPTEHVGGLLLYYVTPDTFMHLLQESIAVNGTNSK